jgi:predicted protein tyrosine phosphatase
MASKAMNILVSPLSHVSDLVLRYAPGRVISLLDPGSAFPELGPAYTDRHLRLAFHDAHSPVAGITVPSAEHIAQLLTFLESWGDNESLLVHCQAGIGRSTATAFVAACYRNPHASELRIATELRRVAPFARPNETVIHVADTLMDRGGRMTAAITETGRGLGWLDIPEAQPFELASRFEAIPN